MIWIIRSFYSEEVYRSSGYYWISFDVRSIWIQILFSLYIFLSYSIFILLWLFVPGKTSIQSSNQTQQKSNTIAYPLPKKQVHPSGLQRSWRLRFEPLSACHFRFLRSKFSVWRLATGMAFVQKPIPIPTIVTHSFVYSLIQPIVRCLGGLLCFLHEELDLKVYLVLGLAFPEWIVCCL